MSDPTAGYSPDALRERLRPSIVGTLNEDGRHKNAEWLADRILDGVLHDLGLRYFADFYESAEPACSHGEWVACDVGSHDRAVPLCQVRALAIEREVVAVSADVLPTGGAE